MAWAAGSSRAWLDGGPLNSTTTVMASMEDTVHGRSRFAQHKPSNHPTDFSSTGRQMLQVTSSSRTFDRSLLMPIQSVAFLIFLVPCSHCSLRPNTHHMRQR